MDRRLIAEIVGGVLLLIVLGVLTWNFDPFGRLKHAKQEAAAATVQASNNGEAVRQVDHYSHETMVIHEKASAAVQAVQSAPGAQQALPDGVRAVWLSSIDGMRNSRPAAANPGS